MFCRHIFLHENLLCEFKKKGHQTSKEDDLFIFFSFLYHIPSESEVYINLIFGMFAFLLFNLGQTFLVGFSQASHNMLLKFWPVTVEPDQV